MSGRGPERHIPRLEERLTDERVLLVNAIRMDMASGGATVTQVLVAMLATAPNSARILHLGPGPANDSGWLRRFRLLWRILIGLPGVFAIPLRRSTGWVALEYFSRLSPILLLLCIWQRIVWRPSVVVLNQHAAFPYGWVFRGLRRIYVWHDVPSAKAVAIQRRGSATSCTSLVERLLVPEMADHFVLSFSEAKRLRRRYGVTAGILPALQRRPLPSPHKVSRGDALLLVGNWHRPENARGAERFLSALSGQRGSQRPIRCVIAGVGADDFCRHCASTGMNLESFDLTIIDSFHDWSEFQGIGALVAPIDSGAGIKLKTLEAWLWNIPVIGTAQAFTGMPEDVWRRGGHLVPDIDAIAALCAKPEAWQAAANKLSPQNALLRYWTQTA